MRKYNNKTKSFKLDISLLEKNFNTNINLIFSKPIDFINNLKQTFKEENGIVDSIKTCLYDLKNKLFRQTLKLLIRPKFLNDDLESLTNIFYSILIKIS